MLGIYQRQCVRGFAKVAKGKAAKETPKKAMKVGTKKSGVKAEEASSPRNKSEKSDDDLFRKLIFGKPRQEKPSMTPEEIEEARDIHRCYNRNLIYRQNRNDMQCYRRFDLKEDAIDELPNERWIAEARGPNAAIAPPIYRQVFTWTPPKDF